MTVSDAYQGRCSAVLCFGIVVMKHDCATETGGRHIPI